MIEVMLSKQVLQECTAEEIVYIKSSVREMMAGKNPFFLPWPATKEELIKYRDYQCEVTFFPIHPDNLDRMVMIVPFFVKSRKCNVWHVSMKDENGRIELDIKTPVQEGHYRRK